MADKSIRAQVLSGFVLAAKLLLGFLTATAFWISIALLSPVSDVVESRSGWLLRFPALSWVFLLLSSAIIVGTMRRWVSIIPGLMAASSFGALIMLVTGEFNRQPVPHSIAAILGLYGIATAVLSATFHGRELKLVDRISLMGFVTCLAVGSTKRESTMLAALGVGFAFLLFAWSLDLVSKHRARSAELRTNLR